jgi:hypothetical protein
MATFYAYNNLYPDNPQLFVIDVKQVVNNKSNGEHLWRIALYTSGRNSVGTYLGPYWLNVVSTEASLTELVNNKVEQICSLIDWSKSPIDDITFFIAQEDRYSPTIAWQYPVSSQIDVPIDSKISIRIMDILPSKGIDISTLTMKVDGMEVIPEVYGNPFDYTITYKPTVGD